MPGIHAAPTAQAGPACCAVARRSPLATPLAYGNIFMTLTSGDLPEIEAPGIGTLRNTVMAES